MGLCICFLLLQEEPSLMLVDLGTDYTCLILLVIKVYNYSTLKFNP